jgi:hypothetical protein
MLYRKENLLQSDSFVVSTIERSREISRESDLQTNFSQMIQECFCDKISIINYLNVAEINKELERYELGKISVPLEDLFKKLGIRLKLLQKVKNNHCQILSILKEIKIIILSLQV